MKNRTPRAGRDPRRPPTTVAPNAPVPADRTPRDVWIGPVATLEVCSSELPEHQFRRLLGAYLGGAREFVVHEPPRLRAATLAVVRTFCRRTRQPEIVSEERETVVVRDLAFDSPVPLARRLDQMGESVVRFHREAVESWAGLPLDGDGSWERRDDEIDREAWYLQRKALLRADAHGSAASSLELWVLARSLERIADHAVALGEAGRRLAGLPHGPGPLATLEQFHAQAMEHLEGVLRATDGAEANDLLDTGEALLASGRTIADRLLPTVGGVGMSPAAAAAVARIIESISRTIAYGQDIAQVVLDRSLDVSRPGRPILGGTALIPAA
jgi:hypothetical protein